MIYTSLNSILFEGYSGYNARKLLLQHHFLYPNFMIFSEKTIKYYLHKANNLSIPKKPDLIKITTVVTRGEYIILVHIFRYERKDSSYSILT